MESKQAVSSVIFYLTPTGILFLSLGAFFLAEEIIMHVLLLDQLFYGGLYCMTLQAPVMIIMLARMSQRVGYTVDEKKKMTRARLAFVNKLELFFSNKKTAKDTLLCIVFVLGINILTSIITLTILAIEIAFFYVNIAIAENNYYQVALIIGLTSMFLYPRKSAGIPAGIVYLTSIIVQSLAADPLLKILLNIIPSIILAIFLGTAKRDINPPSKAFNYAMAFVSAAVFFIAHVNVYGGRLFTWIGTFGTGLVMALFYVNTRNVAVTTWAHVLLNILSLPSLLLATIIITMAG